MAPMAYYNRNGNGGGYNRGGYQKPVQPQRNPVRLERDWSDLQRAIFREIQEGTGNLQVDALAGTGKTTTIVEGLYYIPSGKSALFCAFNKKIKEELETRSPSSVTVKTLNGLGRASVVRAFPNLQNPATLDEHKADSYISAEKGHERETLELRNNLKRAVSLAKGYLATTSEEIDEIMEKHEVETCEEPRDKFIATVIRVLQACKNDTSRIDFDDQIWFPLVHNLSMFQYDYVFIDESQDLNKAQIELALRSVKPGGRVFSVGDEHQAIYGFRGADSNAIQNIVDRMQSKRLPLSVTYRCARKIVEEAKMFVEAYEAGPGNKEGTVETTTPSKMLENVKPGDFILSRVNAPLLGYCFDLIKAGIPANVQGRDVGKGLSALIKKSGASNVSDFLTWLQVWREGECMRLSARNKSIDLIVDKAECLEALCEDCDSLASVNSKIDRIFTDTDDKNRVILSSTHKAKGLERERVWILRDTYKPGKTQEETNLLYVAITRAIGSLYYVRGSR